MYIKWAVFITTVILQCAFFLISAKTDEVLKAKENIKEEKTKEEGEPDLKNFNL